MNQVMSTIRKPSFDIDVEALNGELEGLDAGSRVALLAERFGSRVMATTSFGLQAAVMLKLLKEHAPEIPIVFIDTGYLFPETYRYGALLEEQVGFEAKVYSPLVTAARQEALYGKEWEGSAEESDHYARIHKIEPMNRALQELGADIWISGLRRAQSSSRSERSVVERQAKTLKVYPIIDWDDAQVARYMIGKGLPRHPLGAADYVTMGDWHSTNPGQKSGRESTRFNGEKYECGLHLSSGDQDFQI
jgi:phosphoadenosine phosphosulfate reductase